MKLHPIQADVLNPVRHGFFTREGGVSEGIYQGLNCGVGSNDSTRAVTKNRKRVQMHFGVDQLAGVHQVHSSEVITINRPEQATERPKADALVTKSPGIVLSVLTADCQPVLFSDHDAGVIGAAHAGWKGALAGVLEATVDAMVDLGARASSIKVAIGPTISQRAYEVGPEFFDRMIDSDSDHQRFFAGGKNGKMHFDLPGFGLQLLRQRGVSEAVWTGHCTYSDAEKFYSYRRATHAKEADYGRLLAAIQL